MPPVQRTISSQLAHGLNNTDLPPVGQLFAGEVEILTDQIETGATALTQFQVYAKNEAGQAVPHDPISGTSVGSVTFSGAGTAADNITINGHVITLVASGAVGQQVNIGASAALTAQNLKAYINSKPDETGVIATGGAAVLTLNAVLPGVAGNSLTLAKTSTAITLSGATLTGGSEETESQAVGIACHPIAANSRGAGYIGGHFNHEVLGWAASLTTLIQRKRAFAGTQIAVKRLL